MALVDLDSIESLLVCPRCRSKLTRASDGYHCTSRSCPYHESLSFPIVGDRPVLLDGERSIMSADRVAAMARDTSEPRRQSLRDRVAAIIRGWLRSLVRPPNRVARENVDHLLQLLGEPSPLVLVVGGASLGNGMEALYREPGVRVVAFDIQPSALIQFVADAQQIPLVAGSVRAVVVQAVLEHALEPQLVTAEIHRVLADGGFVYAETPFLQQVHGGQFDFTRFTAGGHRYLFRSFDEIRAGIVTGPGTQLLWSIDHVVRAVFRSQRAGRIARVLCFWLRYLDAVVPAEHATDDACAFFFLGRKSERDLQPRDMATYHIHAE